MHKTLSAFLFLAIGYLVIHPYWYGDAVWFAVDLADYTVDKNYVGQLFWRPLAFALWHILRIFWRDLDPLVPLQILSTFGTALVCVLTYLLALRLGLKRLQALCAAALLTVSNMCLLYGASGSTYTSAMAGGVLAVLFLIPVTEAQWSLRQGLLAAAAMTFAWGMWGVAVLLFPLLFVTGFYFSSGTLARRFVRSFLLCTAAGCAMVLCSLATYALIAYFTEAMPFIDWLAINSHGVPLSFSLLSIARGLLGSVISWVYLGSSGMVIKSVVQMQSSLSELASVAIFLAAAVLFAAFSTWSLYRLAAKVMHGERAAQAVLLLMCSALIPVAGFAFLWQGSDVERFSLALPFIAIAIAGGMTLTQDLKPFSRQLLLQPAMLALAVLILINFSTGVIPILSARGGMVTALGQSARAHMPAGSLLVLTGQGLGPRIWAPSEYFSQVEIYSISYDVQLHGSHDWNERLAARIEATLEKGKSISILADFMGEKSPADLRLNGAEYGVPSIAEIARFFEGWQVQERWSVDGYGFVRVRPAKNQQKVLNMRHRAALNQL